MNVYPAKVTIDGRKQTLAFRLDLRHIRELQEAREKDIFDILTDSFTNPCAMADLIGAALSWKGNDNPVVNGDEAYDLLVEAGYCGPVKWTELAAGIASVSGILAPEHGAAMVQRAKQSMQKLVEGQAEKAEENPI
jgi:hypothetical protein